MKNQYRGGNCLKKGRVGKKEVSGVFKRGGRGDTPMHTMNKVERTKNVFPSREFALCHYLLYLKQFN